MMLGGDHINSNKKSVTKTVRSFSSMPNSSDQSFTIKHNSRAGPLYAMAGEGE